MKFTVLILLITAAALFSFKDSEQKSATKEIMAVIVTNKGKEKLINFSTSGDPSSIRRQRLIKSEGLHDYSGVLKIIKEYQDNGWEIKNSNIATSSYQDFFSYFLLEK